MLYTRDASFNRTGRRAGPGIVKYHALGENEMAACSTPGRPILLLLECDGGGAELDELLSSQLCGRPACQKARARAAEVVVAEREPFTITEVLNAPTQDPVMQLRRDVLTVLSTAEIDGRKVRIKERLKPTLYRHVNETLEALGGKWLRKEQVHVFNDADPAERIDQALTSGSVVTDADLGFFRTPSPLARDLVKLADIRGEDDVLEPSAGDGSLVIAALDAAHCKVTAIERDASRRAQLVKLEDGYGSRLRVSSVDDFMDFMQIHGRGVGAGPVVFDRVIMNPPFCKVGAGDHLAHVRHAFGLLRPGGVLVSVLPASVDFRRDRRHVEFRNWIEAYGTVEPLPEGVFKPSGTSVRTVVARMEAP